MAFQFPVSSFRFQFSLQSKDPAETCLPVSSLEHSLKILSNSAFQCPASSFQFRAELETPPRHAFQFPASSFQCPVSSFQFPVSSFQFIAQSRNPVQLSLLVSSFQFPARVELETSPVHAFQFLAFDFSFQFRAQFNDPAEPCLQAFSLVHGLESKL